MYYFIKCYVTIIRAKEELLAQNLEQPENITLQDITTK